MSIIIYYCDQCASPLDFTGQTSVICQVCGSNNINTEAEKAAIDAKALAEQYRLIQVLKNSKQGKTLLQGWKTITSK